MSGIRRRKGFQALAIIRKADTHLLRSIRKLGSFLDFVTRHTNGSSARIARAKGAPQFDVSTLYALATVARSLTDILVKMKSSFHSA